MDVKYLEGLPITLPHAAVAVVANDFDGDTFPDVVVLDAQGGLHAVLTTLGDTAPQVDVCLEAQALEQGFFNGDGFLDLLVSCPSVGDVMVLVGDSVGHFQVLHTLHTGHLLPSGFFHDANGDAVMDVVVWHGGEDVVTVHPGTGQGLLGMTVESGAGGLAATRDALLVDVDGDNRRELLLAQTGEVRILQADGTGHFSAYGSIHQDGRALAALSLDTTAGQEVVVAGVDGAIHLYRGGMTPSFWKDVALGPLPIHLATADFNGDHVQDLMALDGDGGLFVLAGSERHGLADAVPVQLLEVVQPAGLVAGNIDDQGNVDVVLLDPARTAVTPILNLGSTEACDDGNTDPGDGCSPACRLETAP